MKHIIFTLVLACFSLLYAAPQAALADALVTLDESIQINDAVRILETFSLKHQSKKMLNLSSYSGSIGVPINKIDWQKALELIALKNKLTIDIKPGYIAITDPAVDQGSAIQVDQENLPEIQLVKIEAKALLADKAYLQSLGIDWSTIFDGKVQIDAGFKAASLVPDNLFKIGASRAISWDGKTIDINTLLNVIESNQKGTIIAQPTILVNSEKRGFIQVGQDISVKKVDEAGNTTDAFFATGVILDVIPTIIKVDTTQVVHMKVSIERSSGTPGSVSTIINKSKSETELVLYSGEEIVVGGLYDTDETRIRSGIPILKDLPWWVFGIRYLTGYYKYEKKERELVIIMKVQIVPNALQRQKLAAEKRKTP